MQSAFDTHVHQQLPITHGIVVQHNIRPDTRQKKAGASLKSPYISRVVNISKALSSIELRVSDAIFALRNNPSDILFKLFERVVFNRVTFESLIPGCKAHWSIIDAWILVLNQEEEFRSSSSPHRLFFDTNIIPMEKVNSRQRFDVFFRCFQENIDDRIQSNLDVSLKSVDLVFFPVVYGPGAFACCFDIRRNMHYIIDNRVSSPSLSKHYNGVPKLLQRLFSKYLAKKNHPRSTTFDRVVHVRLEMKWQTAQDTNDDAIFLMRHLETFQGTSVNAWNYGLAEPGDRQVRQLADLRRRYITKILLSGLNAVKEDVLAEVNLYHELSNEMKELFKNVAMKEKEKRMKEYSYLIEKPNSRYL